MGEADARYEVLAVRYGTRLTRKSEVYLHFDAYGQPDGPIGMDYYFWIIRNDYRTVLVDCGFNDASGSKRGRTMLCPPATALARLGIEAESLDQMIVTHAHYDHIGNLPEFPHAELIMSRAEYEFWTGPMGVKTLFAGSAETDDIDNLRARHDAGQVQLIDGRGRLAAGIELVEVGGHTPGQLIVLVDTAGGQVVIASDALHYYEELERDMPFTHVAELPAMYRGFDLLRDLGDGRELIAGHDPDVMSRYPALSGVDVEVVRIG